MFFSLYLSLALLIGEGLAPLQPPPGTTIERQLRSAPDQKALILREILPTDKVRYLRSQVDWYEVELISAEQFTFRGWVKGSLPIERTPPPPPKEAAVKPPPSNPLESAKYQWFFSNKFADQASLSLGLGVQTVEYKLSGTYTQGQKAGSRADIYSYSAPGFSLNVNLNFPLVEFNMLSKKTSIVLDTQYTYGIASVSFNSDFSVSELQGASYTVTSHLYDAKALLRHDSYNGNGYSVSPFLGLGFVLYEVLPDLNPIRGGTFNGELVVGDSNFNGVGLPFGTDFKTPIELNGRVSITPYFLLTDISEDIVNSSAYEPSDFPPLKVQLLLSYEILSRFHLTFDVHYLKFEGSSSGTGTRLGSPYSNGTVTLQSYSALGGVKYTF